MAKKQSTTNLIFRSIALAMGVATVVLSILGTTDNSTLIILLGIGLFAIALASLK
jgi:hypothetical protein